MHMMTHINMRQQPQLSITEPHDWYNLTQFKPACRQTRNESVFPIASLFFKGGRYVIVFWSSTTLPQSL